MIRKELIDKVILAVDPGTVKGGLAIYKDGKVLSEQFSVSGLYQQYGITDMKNYCSRDLRLFVIGQKVEDLILEYGINQIVIEIPVKYRVTISTFYEIIGVIRSVSSKLKLDPVIEMSPSKAKLKVAGHGRASKESMNYNISKIFGIKYNTLEEDEADAVSILYTFLTEGGNK